MIGLFVAAVVGIAVLAQADTRTVSLTVTNGQAITYSDPIPASGELEKIEFVQSSASTATVTIATYTGTTAIETFASLSAWATTTKLVKPRAVGTTTAGVSIVAVVGSGSDALTNLATTVLSAPYERLVVGGNLKMAVTGTANSGTNTVTATLYFKPWTR